MDGKNERDSQEQFVGWFAVNRCVWMIGIHVTGIACRSKSYLSILVPFSLYTVQYVVWRDIFIQ